MSMEAQLLGSTGDSYNCSISATTKQDASLPRENEHASAQLPEATNHKESNYFRSAQWSADGTTLLTCSADRRLRSFVLPTDLLTVPTPHSLTPYSSNSLPSPPYATAIHPAYNLSSPATALYLASLASLPTRLVSPFSPGIIASYPLINKTTEAFIAPHSLLFDTYRSLGHVFFAGSESEISVFDIARDGEGPVSRMKTIPSRRKKALGGGVGMKGIVSALGMSCEGLLAAGTFNRWVGLYDGGGRGGTVGVFEIKKQEDDVGGIGVGAGVTQVMWSNDGSYLCIVERESDGVGIWDIRSTGRRMQWLSGRNARTMQRLSVEVVGDRVYAGGTDGMVRCWEGLGLSEGVVEPRWELKAHEDAVSSAVMHPCGSIMATCSGQRRMAKDASEDEDEGDKSNSAGSVSLESSGSCDNSLKVWTLGSILEG